MLNNVVYFAIQADDVQRAKRFYENVFGWQFEPWGPPDFYIIRTGTESDPGIRGALQARQEPLSGTGMRGFECTIAVESVDDTAKAIQTHGGTITLAKSAIPTVGWLVKFRDTEGNEVSVMRYDESAE